MPKDKAQTAHNKKAMIEALEKSLGVVSTACKAAKVGRRTFYSWCEDDSDFKSQVDSIQNIALDFVESQLYDQIKKGNVASIIFYMKTKGKSRGYIEKTQNELTIKQASTLIIEQVDEESPDDTD